MDRLALLNAAVGPVVVWAAESARPTVAHLRHLIRLERATGRLVYRIPRVRGGDVWERGARRARPTEGIYRRCHLRPWAEQCLEAFWKRAGHFRRGQHRSCLLYTSPSPRD
eukprot:3124439-Alexandrium_andersonii.AAC.1